MKKASIRDLRFGFKKIERLLHQGNRSRLRNDGGLLRALFQNMRKSTCKCRLPRTIARDLRRQNAQGQRCGIDCTGPEPLLKVYADTSFLISLYSPDANSMAAARTMQVSSGDHYMTVFGELEVINALELRIFRKELSAAQVQASMKALRKTCGTGFCSYGPFQTRSLSGRVNCPGKPRHVWVRARPTCCR